MGVKVIEGRWEDVAPQVELAGRRVRVIYQDEAHAVIAVSETDEGTTGFLANQTRAAWLDRLIKFSKSRVSPAETIDLDRDRLFQELHG